MEKIDFKSFIIGLLSATLFFVLIGADKVGEKTGAEFGNGNLGDIVVNSITVMDDGHGGYISTYNQDGKRTVYIGTGENQNGYIRTFNRREDPTCYLGTNKDLDGVVVLNDRYGDFGWSQSGKQ
ncbi:MAG: hypothetical protein HN657_03560 [Candidatus Marinimicrobia bacterium]|jgi:hypothetical protein|nr:hypothetical protein [Deltaproteobacteria bacterium]MBT3299733.1 hypothetical protein [Candidatus Neomarinimicrobiota bacterium]MBT3496902.1 hypothetical protein [Candidatus Neomarinimicrobiota bacterium]MBT3692358.1 hypothetical protein [Candidatus Neomarinimicrobiota bacterium]MBT3732539.1 hypothetical protein [Candidatus Neomarinimicrobiota bacterium]